MMGDSWDNGSGTLWEMKKNVYILKFCYIYNILDETI